MEKEKKLNITKEKLINAAAELICEGADGSDATTRAIAKRAGVQLSMINYCFGSREALLYEVFSRNRQKYIKSLKIEQILRSEISPKEKLRKMHYIAAEYFVKEYKITRAVMGYVLLHRDLSEEQSSLPFVKAHFAGRKTDEECKIIAYELSSMIQLIIFRLDDFRELSGMDLRDTKQLHRLIDMRIDTLLGD